MSKIVYLCDACVFLLGSGEKGADCGDEAIECFFEGGEGEPGEFALVGVGAFTGGGGVVGHDGIAPFDRGRSRYFYVPRAVILMALFLFGTSSSHRIFTFSSPILIHISYTSQVLFLRRKKLNTSKH